MAKTRKKKNSRPKPKTARQPAFAADPQNESMLFELLPQELRDKIYSHVFFSTRLAYGQRAVSQIDRIRIKPAPNALASTLRLLPGLRLDILTVLGLRTKEVSYDTLNSLIRESCGWKELQYISHSSEVLGFAKLERLHFGDEVEKHRYWRKPQPEHWQSILEDRDGALSRPPVAIYRSTVSDCPGSVINVNARARFEQKMPEDTAAQEAFGIAEDAGLMAYGERGKKIMIIVKRGAGVNYEQKKDSRFIQSDIRRDMPGKTWKEIRYECIDRIFVDDDSRLRDDKDEEETPEIDEPTSLNGVLLRTEYSGGQSAIHWAF